jgi:hypothetical protein
MKKLRAERFESRVSRHGIRQEYKLTQNLEFKLITVI